MNARNLQGLDLWLDLPSPRRDHAHDNLFWMREWVTNLNVKGDCLSCKHIGLVRHDAGDESLGTKVRYLGQQFAMQAVKCISVDGDLLQIFGCHAQGLPVTRKYQVWVESPIQLGSGGIISDGVAVLIHIVPAQAIIALVLVSCRQNSQSIDLELDCDRVSSVTGQGMQRHCILFPGDRLSKW